MKQRIDRHINAHGGPRLQVEILTRTKMLRKKQILMVGVFAGQRQAASVKSILRSHKMPLLTFMLDGSTNDRGRDMLATHLHLVAHVKFIRLAHLTESQADDIRRFLNTKTGLPGGVHHDVIDVAGTSRKGVYHVLHVCGTLPMLQHLVDAITIKLDNTSEQMHRTRLSDETVGPVPCIAWPDAPDGIRLQANHRIDDDDAASECSGHFSLVAA